eukprot:CFRG5393T1
MGDKLTLPVTRRRTRSLENTPSMKRTQESQIAQAFAYQLRVLEEKVATSFHFRCDHDGIKEVYVCGSWSNWTERIPLVKQFSASGSEDVFVCMLNIKVGIHTYKFIVDGKWTHAPDQQIMSDQAGNINNCISVTYTNPNAHLPGSPTDGDRFLVGEFYGNLTSPKSTREPFLNQFLIPGVNDVTKSSILRDRTLSGPHLAIAQKQPTGLKDTTNNLNDRRLVIIMVGLPARGKSFVSSKVARYLKWIGYETKVFNIGSYRRDRLGSFHNHDFFRPDNPEGIKARTEMCLAAVEDIGSWLDSGGNIAVLDGTNHTKERRNLILDRLDEIEDRGYSIKTMFIEIICNEKHIIDKNIQLKRLFSPDYKDLSEEQAEQDFRARVRHYEDSYETLSDKSQTYVKIFNVGQEVGVNRVHGYLPSRIVFFLMNLHIEPRAMYLSRHGESEYNVDDRIGGNSRLTSKGRAYAGALKKFMVEPSVGSSGPKDVNYFSTKKELCVWSSTMQRAVETASGIPCNQYVQWKALYPEEAAMRDKDKLGYRYPGAGGESYQDLCVRLEPVIMELERTNRPLLIVSHRATIRCLFAYLMDVPATSIPYTPIPLHTVIRLISTGYGTTVDYFDLSENGRNKPLEPLTTPPTRPSAGTPEISTRT